jgi:hypothetical protein
MEWETKPLFTEEETEFVVLLNFIYKGFQESD